MRISPVLIFLLVTGILTGCFNDSIVDLVRKENILARQAHQWDFPISDTGQTEEHHTWGSDGHYINIPGAIDFDNTNDDGTITDNVTGLVWTKCTLDINGQVDNDGTCTLTPEQLSWEDAAELCSKLELNNRKWRLPTMQELSTLISFHSSGTAVGPAGDYVPSIDLILFPDTQITIPPDEELDHVVEEILWTAYGRTDNDVAKYWTLTRIHSSLYNSSMAYNVNFYNGFSNIQLAKFPNVNYARCISRTE